MLDRLILIFPVILILAICVMIWALQGVSDQFAPHPSAGQFESGTPVTQNGISGTVIVTTEPQPMGNRWFVRLQLADEHGHPVNRATVFAHGVEGTRYLEPFPLPPGKAPGVWEGTLLLLEGATTVMVHADLPGGRPEEWVSEWYPVDAPPPAAAATK